MPDIATVRPPRNGPIIRQRIPWYSEGLKGWANVEAARTSRAKMKCEKQRVKGKLSSGERWKE
jgi:hypothetical protein